MGYANYEINGKECGYGVEAKCEEPGCTEDIDRGLSFLCGQEPGGDEHACGGYFCAKHLFMGKGQQLCERCHDKAPDLCEECDEPATVTTEDGEPLCAEHAKSIA